MSSKKGKSKAKEAQEEAPIEEILNAEVVEEQSAEENTEENTEEQAEETVAEEVEEKDELTLALEKVMELSDKQLRLQAEFDNYRKRTLKEKMELTKTAGEGIIKDILPVIDDFERAIITLDKAEDVDAAREGLSLIFSKFDAFLKQKGVSPISTKDGNFDTELHEAITQIPAPSKKLKGKIIDCVQKGYTLNEKVIRHSQVVVGA
jgi:molecular chaperone GrpE